MGLLFAVPALAVAFSFRVIGFPDLTPDGSFVLGAAVGAVSLQSGFSPPLALLAAIACGSLAGVATVAIHHRLRISKLLSGILTMTMLYSVSLWVMGTSNISLLNLDSFFAKLPSSPPFVALAGMVTPVAIAIIFLTALLNSERGVVLRATGDNESALAFRGIPSD
jgi:putative ABC transport system permease protein